MFRAQRELIKVFQSGRVAVIRISHKKGVNTMRLRSLIHSVRRFISPGLPPRSKRINDRRRLLLEQLEGRVVPTVGVTDYYTAINLVSNVKGMALKTDPNLVNPWGLNNPQDTHDDLPVVVADQGTGVATSYQISQDGSTVKKVKPDPTVTIPTDGPSEPTGPTGVVPNIHPNEFLIPGSVGSVDPTTYIFDTLQGTIVAYNGTSAETVYPTANNSSAGAEYTGLAVGTDTVDGNDYIYAANDGTNPGIQVFNRFFKPVNLADKNDPSPFSDPKLPAGFIPYGVRDIPLGTLQEPYLVVTYRSPNYQGGAIAVFGNDGTFLGQIASDTAAFDGTVGTVLQSPWGLAVINQTFGQFSADDLFVGNFSSGHIYAYTVTVQNGKASGQYAGELLNKDGSVLTIPGLRTIHFGPGLGSGRTHVGLLFTGGNDKSGDGNVSLYGEITPVRVTHRVGPVIPPGQPYVLVGNGSGIPLVETAGKNLIIGGPDGRAASGNGGGGGNEAWGGGLLLGNGIGVNQSSGNSDTWVLSDDIVSFNAAGAGDDGSGGHGSGFSGDGDEGAGAGVFDGFNGTLELFSSLIVNNTVQDAGAGGVGGGQYINNDTGPALATPDTQIIDNSADSDANVAGTLGTL